MALSFEARRQRADREHDERMHLAWVTGALHRAAIVSAHTGAEFPRLETLLSSWKPEPKTAEELAQFVFAWLGPPPAKTEEPPADG